MKIFSALQIREADAYTIAHEPIEGIELMERAANQCAAWIENRYPGGKSFRIFCGMGNNGGDGLAIARLLYLAGHQVSAYIVFYGKDFSADCLANKTRLEHLFRFPLHAIHDQEDCPTALPEDTIIIDALFGTGLTRPLTGLAAAVLEKINALHRYHPVIAIDLPSGMFADSTAKGSLSVQADFTLSFQFYKLSFLMPENANAVGEVIILPIGLHAGYIRDTATLNQIVDEDLLKSIFKKRSLFSHKGSYGHALIIAGSYGKMGAAVLSARACLRGGAGLLTCYIPEKGVQIMQTAVPEAMCVTGDPLSPGESPLGAGISLEKFSAIGIGPGLGTAGEQAEILEEILRRFKKPLVIDADALNIMAIHPELFALLPPYSILTPHPKEFERLFGKTADDFERLALLREKAAVHQVFILLKGHYSCIACPDGHCYFNPTGNPGMATGGSGDVLTGLLTGLLAQGYSAPEAALLGAYLHGMAGDIAASCHSQEAMVAGDIVENLGNAFKFMHKI